MLQMCWWPRNKETLLLWTIGFLKIPMIFYLRPQIIELNEKKIVRIPLGRRAKNHLNAMYFGALSVGADCAIGYIAMQYIRKHKNEKINLIFKDFKAEFLKRAEGDVDFICTAGDAIQALMQKCSQTMEREELSVPAIATVPSKNGDEAVAKFSLTLSVKRYPTEKM